MIQPLDISPDLLIPVTSGSSTALAASGAIAAVLELKYGRAGLCLKIFTDPTQRNLIELCTWHGSTVIEASQVQNLFALHGLAPFVLGLALLHGGLLAQVTEYVIDDGGTPDLTLVRAIRSQHGIGSRNLTDGIHQRFDCEFDCNWIGAKLVDFGGWYFTDLQAYRREVITRLRNVFANPNSKLFNNSRAEGVRAIMELANLFGYWDMLAQAAQAGAGSRR